MKATCVNDPVAKPTVQPNEPSLNVLSEPIFIHSLLMKPTRTFEQAVEALPLIKLLATKGRGSLMNGFTRINVKVFICKFKVGLLWLLIRVAGF